MLINAKRMNKIEIRGSLKCNIIIADRDYKYRWRWLCGYHYFLSNRNFNCFCFSCWRCTRPTWQRRVLHRDGASSIYTYFRLTPLISCSPPSPLTQFCDRTSSRQSFSFLISVILSENPLILLSHLTPQTSLSCFVNRSTTPKSLVTLLSCNFMVNLFMVLLCGWI